MLCFRITVACCRRCTTRRRSKCPRPRITRIRTNTWRHCRLITRTATSTGEQNARSSFAYLGIRSKYLIDPKLFTSTFRLSVCALLCSHHPGSYSAAPSPTVLSPHQMLLHAHEGEHGASLPGDFSALFSHICAAAFDCLLYATRRQCLGGVLQLIQFLVFCSHLANFLCALVRRVCGGVVGCER